MTQQSEVIRNEQYVKSKEKTGTRNIAIIVVTIWFLITTAAAQLGLFDIGRGPPIAMLISFLAPVAIFAGLYLRSSRFAKAVGSWSLNFLTLAQTTRIEGFVFLLYFAIGKLPGFFAIPAGIGDVIAGVTAPLVALFLVPKLTTVRKYLFIAWTVYGMYDLIQAMTLGVLSTSSFASLLHILPTSNPTIATLPLSIIPTFQVPLLFILEILALLKIREKRPNIQTRYSVAALSEV